jgi:hypothetical protein
MAILYCEIGEHLWTREGRGRPPKNCPEHKPVEEPKIKVNVSGRTSAKSPPEKKLSITDIIPEAGEYLEQQKKETLWCEGGAEGHEWQRESKRGKKPRFCPEHSQIGQVVRKAEMNRETLEKMRSDLLARIETQRQRIRAADAVDNIAYEEYCLDKEDETAFKKWMRYDTIMMHECEALAGMEKKLEAL